jgi:hypothetical protein
VTTAPAAPLPAATAVVGNVVTAEMAGRPCPYCRFPLKEGGEASPCPGCKAVHHADCWNENDGCAVNGCGMKAVAAPPAAVSPDTTTVLPSQVSAPAAATGQYGTAPAAPAVTLGHGSPPPNRGRGAWQVVLVALVIVLALGGSAVALVISTQKKDSSTTTTDASRSARSDTPAETPVPSDPPTADTSAPSSTGGTGTGSDTTEPPAYGAAGPSPDSGDSSGISDAATQVLTAHHDGISDGSYDEAWQEFSPRYRSRKLNDVNTEGESYSDGSMTTAPSLWQHDMDTEFPSSIDTSQLHARVVRLTGDNDALVKVTGMTYEKGGATCPYDGLTWVHYQRGEWWYDPGTNHHPERRSEFGNGSVAADLFRGRCG